MVNRHLAILRIVVGIGATSAPYNQFSLPLVDQHNITICSYFPSDFAVPEKISYFEGDGSVQGFFRLIRVVLNKRNFDVIHVHSPHTGLLLLGAGLVYQEFGLPTVITVHSSYPVFRPRNRAMLLPVFALFRQIVFCSYSSFFSFPLLFRKVAGSRATVIQNGFDTNHVRQVTSTIPTFAPGDLFTVVSVGRLVAGKNYLTIIKAMQKVTGDSKLAIVGDGPQFEALQLEMAQRGIANRVEMTGLLSRDLVYQRMVKADLFVSASFGEGLPVAALEAMACGCPVILSDIPPHREIAEGIDFVPLVPPDDADAFAREIRRVMQMHPSQRRVLGLRGKQHVESRFSLARMHREYERVYAKASKAQSK